MADYALEYWIGAIKVREYRTAPSKEAAATLAFGDVVRIEEIREENDEVVQRLQVV